MGGSLKNINEYLKNLPTGKLNPEKTDEATELPESQPVSETKPGFGMKRLVGVAVIVIVLATGGFFYYDGGKTYSYHLRNARVALDELETVLGEDRTIAWFPVAYAENGSAIDERAVAQLSEKVVEETETAIEKVEEINDAGVTSEALAEVSVIQDETIDVLDYATNVISGEEAIETVAVALLATSLAREGVADALDAVGNALADGKSKVSFDVITAADGASISNGHYDDEIIVSQYDDASAALTDLIDSGYGTEEEIYELQAKMIKAEIALKENKGGRVIGLCTAIQAKTKNIRRNAPKEVESAGVAEEVVSEAAEKTTKSSQSPKAEKSKADEKKEKIKKE